MDMPDSAAFFVPIINFVAADRHDEFGKDLPFTKIDCAYAYSANYDIVHLLYSRGDTMKFVGIDLAGSPNRPTGFCAIDERKHVHCKLLFSNSEIIENVKKSGAKVAAIDAPLALPKGRHCLKEHCRGRTHFRSCDRALSMMRIKFFPITIGPMRTLTARGIHIAGLLKQIRVETIETFPGASQDILGIPRKQNGEENLQQALRSLGCRGDADSRRLTGDELDAVNCALVAKEYASGSYLAIGDPSEILMILPKPTQRHKR